MRKISVTIPRCLASVLLVAFVLLSLSVYDRLLCPERTQDGACGMGAADAGGDGEDECDHCLACLVSHGHLPSLAVEGDSSPQALPSIAGSTISRSLFSDPRAHEFFHPPTAASC